MEIVILFVLVILLFYAIFRFSMYLGCKGAEQDIEKLANEKLKNWPMQKENTDKDS